MRQDGVQQVSDSASIARAGPFECPFPDPSAQNSQHLWKTFCLWSRDTLPNNRHFLLLLQHPKGMPDGASVKWHAARTPQSPAFNPGCHMAAPSENASLLTEYLLEGSVTLCFLTSFSTTVFLESGMRWWDASARLLEEWTQTHSSVILAHCPADSSWWCYTLHHPDMPRALIYPQLQLSQLRHLLSAPRVYGMKPWLTHLYSGVMLCSLQGFHENYWELFVRSQ